MDNSIWAAHVTKHLQSDLKMNADSGYAPAASVLGQREEGRQRDLVKSLGKTVRADFWMDGNSVGFRDNKNPIEYDAAMKHLAQAVKQAGLGTVKAMTWKPNEKLVKEMVAKHPEWVALMTRKGAKIPSAESLAAVLDSLSEHVSEGAVQMDTKTNSILSQLVSILEAAGMKCSACGCSLAKGEAKKAGDGEMLCEACWGESAEMEAKGFECKECGKKLSKPVDECPKCGGSDIDLAEMADANDEDSLDEGGAKFKKLVSQFKKRGDIEDPKALAAWIGRKKYGKSKFQKMAVAGRKSKG